MAVTAQQAKINVILNLMTRYQRPSERGKFMYYAATKLIQKMLPTEITLFI